MSSGKPDAKERTTGDMGRGYRQPAMTGGKNQKRGDQVGSEALSVIHLGDALADSFRDLSGMQQTADGHSNGDQ